MVMIERDVQAVNFVKAGPDPNLAGKAPFKLGDYQRWYEKLNIKRD